MKILNLKIWVFLFLLVGVGNLLMMVDTILTSQDQVFTIFSIRTSKWINVVFYSIVASVLIYTGVYQYEKLSSNK